MNETSGFSLIIATFNSETNAAKAVEHLLTRHRAERDSLPAAALVSKDSTGKLTIKETGDIGTKTGAATGALIGGVLGLFSKRSTLGTAALGALLGGVAARKLDTGIPDPRLEAIGRSLEMATGAAVAIVEDSTFGGVEELLVSLGGSITREPFAHGTDFMKQLQSGNLAGAARTLADRAEGAVAGAADAVGDLGAGRSDAAHRAKETPEGQGFVTTDEEKLESVIGASSAALLTSTDTQATPDYSPWTDAATNKPVPQPTPAQVAGNEALPSDDAGGGVAQEDINPPGAGVGDLRPPAI
ncbi:DUF1269 domain-containing protein [Promineifilum sp.]|uniref:DUF1269 domain-containing protein n=1 Tax=Promineifilum sp. TaxID=2664178 RepID=UPI0035AEB18E